MRIGGRLIPLVALLAAACAPQPDAPAGPVDPSRVEFMDSTVFDRQLSEALYATPDEVTVVPLAPVGLNDVPDRLDKWLHAVKESGGKVKAAAVPDANSKERGIVGALIDVVLSLFDLSRERALYAPAAKYDATLFYDQATGKVREVVLRKRLPAEPAS